MNRIFAIQEHFAGLRLHVLLLAKRLINVDNLGKGTVTNPTLLEDHLMALNVDLTIVGLIALIDPPCQDTPKTVHVCCHAGIRFTMVTGILASYIINIGLPTNVIQT